MTPIDPTIELRSTHIDTSNGGVVRGIKCFNRGLAAWNLEQKRAKIVVYAAGHGLVHENGFAVAAVVARFGSLGGSDADVFIEERTRFDYAEYSFSVQIRGRRHVGGVTRPRPSAMVANVT